MAVQWFFEWITNFLQECGYFVSGLTNLTIITLGGINFNILEVVGIGFLTTYMTIAITKWLLI